MRQKINLIKVDIAVNCAFGVSYVYENTNQEAKMYAMEKLKRVRQMMIDIIEEMECALMARIIASHESYIDEEEFENEGWCQFLSQMLGELRITDAHGDIDCLLDRYADDFISSYKDKLNELANEG